jgi:hypothetical protein
LIFDTDFTIELCGGQDHLDIYGYNNTVPNPLVSTSSSSAVTSTTTSLSSTSQTSSTSSSTSGLSSPAVNNVQATSTGSTASQSSSTQPSISSASTSSTSTASSASATASWAYVGCWTDAVGSRTLGNQMTGNANIMTAELCMSECKSAGYSIAGLEYYSECYCDTQIRNGGVLATDPTTCNTACNVSQSSSALSSYKSFELKFLESFTNLICRETRVRLVVAGTDLACSASELARVPAAVAAVCPCH